MDGVLYSDVNSLCVYTVYICICFEHKHPACSFIGRHPPPRKSTFQRRTVNTPPKQAAIMSTRDNEADLRFYMSTYVQSIKTMQPINPVIAHGKPADALDSCYLVESSLGLYQCMRLLGLLSMLSAEKKTNKKTISLVCANRKDTVN